MAQSATTDPVRGSLLSRAPVLAYVALAYAFTWSIGLLLLAERRGLAEIGISERWEAAAAFGPFVAALVVLAATAGADGVRGLMRSLAHWRVGPAWLAISALSPFVLLAFALLALRIATGAWPDVGNLPTGRLATLAGVVELVVVTGLAQGLGEEPGWRGFMLPRLRLRFSPLVATLVLFPVWLFWHLPAFLGRPEFGVGQWFAFSAGVLSAAVWLTWIHERTGSALMAVVWHTLINVARGIALAVSVPLFLAFSTFVLLGAALIAAGPLRRNPPAASPGHPGHR